MLKLAAKQLLKPQSQQRFAVFDLNLPTNFLQTDFSPEH